MALDWYEKLIGNYNRSSERIQQALAKRKLFRTVQSFEEIVKCRNGKVAVKKQRHLSVVYYIYARTLFGLGLIPQLLQ